MRLRRECLSIWSFILLGKLIVFISACSSEDSVGYSNTKQEAKVVARLVFELYLEEPGLVKSLMSGPEPHRALFQSLEDSDALKDLEYCVRGRRLQSWKDDGRILDQWDRPFRVSMHSLESDLLIGVASAGPDRHFGTDDDIAYDIVYDVSQ